MQRRAIRPCCFEDLAVRRRAVRARFHVNVIWNAGVDASPSPRRPSRRSSVVLGGPIGATRGDLSLPRDSFAARAPPCRRPATLGLCLGAQLMRARRRRAIRASQGIGGFRSAHRKRGAHRCHLMARRRRCCTGTATLRPAAAHLLASTDPAATRPSRGDAPRWRSSATEAERRRWNAGSSVMPGELAGAAVVSHTA